MRKTYVADVDGIALLDAAGGVIGEWVGGDRGITSVVHTADTGTTIAAATTVAKSTATTTKAAATKTASKSSTPARETATTVTSHGRPCKSILANLEQATLPVVAVELLDSVASIVGRLENDNTRTLRSAILAEMDVGANDAARTSCEEVISQ